MNQEEIIEVTKDYVRNSLAGAEAGHDWWHIFRVYNLSRKIAKTEKVDMFTVELGALLHDIADSKFCDGDEEVGPKKAREFLTSIGVDEKYIVSVQEIISNISFRKGNSTPKSLELAVVQDADRLDAMGAMGIARTFNYGGFIKREIYNPEIPPQLNMTPEEYKKRSGPTLNHFYEKLLLLKDTMNTDTGRKLAEHRHEFMEKYLEEFHLEWEGNL